MRTCCYIFAALSFLAAALALQAAEQPIIFARSGQKVTLSVGANDNEKHGLVALIAFGKLWGEPVIAQSGMAEFVAPEVRVPIVFRPMSLQDSRIISRELVVYPDRWISWDKDKQLPREKDTQLAAISIPHWFDTWLDAVGLSVEKFSGPESLTARHWRILEKPALLILGRKAAGNGPDEVERLAAEYQTNVLVLEADWLGNAEMTSDAIVVLPKHASGALADLKTQDWPLPPTFCRSAIPWPGMANRQAWIAGEKYPLVEELRTSHKGTESLRIVLSYAPWQDQLGRCEMADELFLRLLTETAKGTKDRQPLDARWCLLYPAITDINPDARPVLAAALRSAEANIGGKSVISAKTDPHENRGYVLDLRGKTPPPANWLGEAGDVKAIEARIDESTPLLILGDNPVLDTWKWLKLDREHHWSSRPGVLWWPDGSLPPSLESQLHLMQLFTEWNVFLGDISQERSNEDKKNEP